MNPLLHEHPFALLERLYHEPARLAVVSSLCHNPEGCSFADLKAECRLTDGNLNRHLKMLSDGGVVSVTRHFGAGRPQTMVRLTGEGRDGFLSYLTALEEVLRKAATAMEVAQEASALPDAPVIASATQA